MPYFGSAIGGLAEGFGQGLTYAERFRMLQQQQQDRERMMAAQEQAGNLIAQQYSRPPVQQQAPVPSPPQPGPPPGVSPTPAPIGGQAPTQPPGDPMPRTAPMGPQGPAPIPPYQPMPTGVAPQQTAQGIPPPPQRPQQMTFENVAQGLVAQGLKGRELMDALTQLAPMMGMEYKQQITALNQELKMYDIALKGRRTDIAETAEERRSKQGQERIDIARERLNAGLSGKPKSYKPRVVMGDDGKRYSEIVSPDGTLIYKDSKGEIIDPDLIGFAGPAGQQTMRNTVKLDISEIDYALDEIAKLDSKTASPFFMDDKQSGWMERFTKNEMTPSEMQVYDTYMNRVAQAIAGMQSMGRGLVSDTKVREARKLVPVPGDSDPAIKAKLQQIRAIRDRALGIIKGKSPEELREGALPKGIPPGSKLIGNTPKGIDVYQAPDGTKHVPD